MNTTQQLSDMFTYEKCVSVITQTPEIVFYDVVILQDIITPKETLQRGEFFAEARLDFRSMVMTFFSDHPHRGYEIECKVNIRIERE